MGIIIQGLRGRYLVTQGYQAATGTARYGVMIDARRGGISVDGGRGGVEIASSPGRVPILALRETIEVRTT